MNGTLWNGRNRGAMGVAGILTGAVLGTAFALFAGAAVAERAATSSRALLDATHLPPLLTAPGEQVELRYDVHCAPVDETLSDAPCDAGGTVFVRAGVTGAYRALPLRLDPTAGEGRHVALVPTDIARSRHGFTYYAVLEGKETGETVTLPAGGAEAPQRSLPLDRAINVSLGRHVFGAARRADARVLETRWGDAPTEVGLERGRNLGPIGASSFDVDRSGTVHLLDQVHRRLLRWHSGAASPVAIPVPVDGTLADMSRADDGTIYVLETGRSGRPLVRILGIDGKQRGVTELGERTASQIRIGPRGPIVLQQPSGQWFPAALDGHALDVTGQNAEARSGRLLRGGGEVVVLRRGNEIRAAIVGAGGVRRSWRVTSETSVGEVQLAEPLGSGLLLIARLYTDTSDEFVALVLGQNGLIHRTSLDSADWAETAPLSRFRLEGSSLYQLGSTATELFVDRFDLEVS